MLSFGLTNPAHLLGPLLSHFFAFARQSRLNRLNPLSSNALARKVLQGASAASSFRKASATRTGQSNWADESGGVVVVESACCRCFFFGKPMGPVCFFKGKLRHVEQILKGFWMMFGEAMSTG